jgi:phage-related protein
MIQIITAGKQTDKELNSLPLPLKAKFTHIVELINEFGIKNIGIPYLRYLEKDLWEIRLKAKDNIGRVIYVLQDENRMIILHSFIKKTQKTPRKAIKVALSRMENLK